MAKERFAKEFKSEAVRQVVEWGHTVADVAKRLGFSAQGLYK
jgi:transposase